MGFQDQHRDTELCAGLGTSSHLYPNVGLKVLRVLEGDTLSLCVMDGALWLIK